MADNLSWLWEMLLGKPTPTTHVSDPIPDSSCELPGPHEPASPHEPPPLPTVLFRRVRISLSTARVQSLHFGSQPIQPVLYHEDRTPRAEPARRPTIPRAPVPRELPLRERLLALLQPPIESLLGDNRLYLPFDPFPYQYEGIGFLAGRWSAVLADEMGLGKTMQAVMATRLLIRSGQVRSALFVCPKPLMTNWQREFGMWAEEMPVRLCPSEGPARRHFWLMDPSVIKVVNYETLTRDADLLGEAQLSFDLVVLDEAQRIKNRGSQTASAAHALRRRRSWALTGTPIENRADDLVSILDFVHNRRSSARDDVNMPNVSELREAVGEVILRRTKDMVMDELPERLNQDVYVDLGPEQQLTYDRAEKEGVVHLRDAGEEVSIEHVFKLIGQLKQICNFCPATGESAKLELLRESLAEVVASGKKAIVFSQYVWTLEEIGRRLADYRPLLYHGNVPHRQRDEIIRQFREDADRPVILLSYGTGAVGLNLQFSNYVFLFDRWWNPAIEDQAINRAHRIGQKGKVFVTRYIVPNSIEARIAQVLQQKRDLFESIIDGHEPSEANFQMSADEIFGLFDLKVRRKAA